MEEKEQKYLRTYKENQELHANLIEERSASGRGHRGSVISTSNAFPDLGGYKEKTYDDYSPKKNKNGSAADSEVLNLKIQQMEKQIKHLEDERENVEQELYSKKAEVLELKSRLQEQSKEFNMKIRDLEYQLDILHNEREENNTKVARRIEELEKEKLEFIEEQKQNTQLQIQQIEEQEKEVKDRLHEQIRELQQEGYKRTDEFLQLGVKMDELKEQLTISKENEAKLKNAND